MKNVSPLTDDVKKQQLHDQSKLAELYPTPKTYEERKQDNEHRQEMMRARQPKHLIRSTSLSLYGLWVVTVLGICILPSLIITMTLAGVFLTFLFGLVLLVLFRWCYGTIANRFYALDMAGPQFLMVYTWSIVPSIAVFIQKATVYAPAITVSWWSFLIVSAVHFSVVILIIQTLRSERIGDGKKVGILGAVMLISAVVAVLLAVVV